MSKRDINGDAQRVQALAPANVVTTGSSDWVKVNDAEEVAILLAVGLYQAGAFVITAEYSNDGLSSDGTVAAGDLDGTFPTLSASNDNALHVVGYQGGAAYIRVTITEPTSPNPAGCVIGVVVEKHGLHLKPAA